MDKMKNSDFLFGVFWGINQTTIFFCVVWLLLIAGALLWLNFDENSNFLFYIWASSCLVWSCFFYSWYFTLLELCLLESIKMEIVFNCLPFLLSISGVHLLNIFQEECLSHILCRPGNQRMQKSVWYLPSDSFLSDIDTSCPQVAFVAKTQRLQIRQISKMRGSKFDGHRKPNSFIFSTADCLSVYIGISCIGISSMKWSRP